AEDGIRDFHVTGVQTCALPISGEGGQADIGAGSVGAGSHGAGGVAGSGNAGLLLHQKVRGHMLDGLETADGTAELVAVADIVHRSEEHTSELQSRENLVCRLLL